MKILMSRYIKSLIIIVLSCIYLDASGQFYNGHQMKFGKNKVQYFNYYWSFYRFDDFDCYFNEYGRELAQYTADYATKKLEEIQDYFDYTLDKRMIFIIYNKNAEFKQSNIGLVTFEEDSYNTGGFNRIINNKVMLYYEGDHIAYQKQISAAISRVVINEMLYNADVKDRISSSSTIQLPDWYIKGLTNYVAYGWDYEAENRVKDGLISGKYKNINHLEYDDAIDAGQSFWRFIGKKYGDAMIPNIVYLTKIYKNVKDGLLYVIGKDLKELLKEWKEFYLLEYAGDEGKPGDDGNVLKKTKKDQIFQQVEVSPDGRYIAYIINDWGRKKIGLYNQVTGKTKIIFRAEPKFEQVTDKTYPVLGWHPSGRILTFISDVKADLVLYFYSMEEKSIEKRNLLYFDKVLDFSYSPEGARLVLSAVKDGVTDLYIHTISSGTNQQITRDVADDLNPSFLKSPPERILFSSNRLTDTVTNTGNPFEKVGLTFDLFILNTSGTNVLTRLSEGKFVDRYSPSDLGNDRLTYLGNETGILNRYTATFDSAISYIDTTTHYRFFIKSQPVTDYDRNIINHSVNGSDTYGEVVYNKRKYNLRKGLLSNADPIPADEIEPTAFRQERNEFLHKADSIEQLRQWLILEDKKRRDTLKKPLYEYYAKDEPIDINHYIFEQEKENFYDQLWKEDYMDVDLDTGELELPAIRIYQPSFYNNYVSNQIDFSFLNNSYQVFSGGAEYFNPGVNLMTRIGTLDLFEDYRVTGGFRFSGNFDSNEYLLSVENLKGKFDKQAIFHRQVFFASDNDNQYIYKIYTHNVYLSYSKPFTPVLALKSTLSYRNDRQVMLAIDLASLREKDLTKHWASLKEEIIYDNTRKRSINIYYGTRFKIFGEYYRELTQSKSDMFVLGIDFRKYTRIHRELIWANRFAASTSFGPTKLVYYLGGVDNWMGYLFNKYPMFDNSIPVSQTNNYGFQAIATNMRGFTQNVRNGNNFALINSEIRWPFIRYFAGHPLRSNFLNSLQVVGFGDIGTAWSGKNPWSGENAYDTEVIESGPVTVTLDSNRQPIVAGVGAGARAQLMGYFIRADWAWGIENNYILPRIFYLSFSLDF